MTTDQRQIDVDQDAEDAGEDLALEAGPSLTREALNRHDDDEED